MSVWRRLQRVGKKAAQFEFTLSLQHCTIQCNKQYTPGNLVVVLTRRSRRHSSKPFKCSQSIDDVNVYNHVWSVPDNMVFTTTLYRGEKALQFEEKAWTCQVEDIGGASGDVAGVSRGRMFPGQSVRRRVLATRQIDLSEFASGVTCQQSLCIHLRMATKHMLKATITLTLNSVIVKEGEATDEDMISVASLMSLSRAGSFNLGSGLAFNDAGAFSPPTLPRFASGRFSRFPGSFANPSGSIGNFNDGLEVVRTRLEKLESGGGGGDDKKLETDEDSGSRTTPAGNRRGYQVSVSTMSLSNTGQLSRACQGAVPTQSSQDLLTWCQEVTKGYAGVHITNLTTSFQSGLAFCAILHHFFPEKIQYPSQPSRSQGLENCRLAFEVAAKLGVPRVLEPAEITSPMRPPDLLSMMTYLHQIRTRCCPETAAGQADSSPTREPLAHPTPTQLDDVSASSKNTPPVVVVVDNGWGPAAKTNNADVKRSGDEARSETVVADDFTDTAQNTVVPVASSNSTPPPLKSESDEQNAGHASRSMKPPRQTASVRCDHMLAKAQSLLEETRKKETNTSPVITSSALPPPPSPRRSPNTRPMGAGVGGQDVAKTVSNPVVSVAETVGGRNELPSPGRLDPVEENNERPVTPQLSVEHSPPGSNNCTVDTGGGLSPAACHSDESKDLSPAVRSQTGSRAPTDEVGRSPSPSPSLEVGDVKVQRLRLSQFMLFDKGRGSGAPVPIRIGEHRLKPNGAGSPKPARGQEPSVTRTQIGVMNPSGVKSFPAHGDDLVGQNSESLPYFRPLESPPFSSTADYISNEQAELERAQRELDEEASGVEQRLRVLMSRNQSSDVADKLLRRWFLLVNKKSALSRRGIQLSIMEKEEDLQKKVQMLQNELHEMSKIEDYLKTDHDRQREDLLLRDLVQLVNTRDELIHQLDIQEQGLAEDLRLSTEQALKLRHTDKGCVLQ